MTSTSSLGTIPPGTVLTVGLCRGGREGENITKKDMQEKIQKINSLHTEIENIRGVLELCELHGQIYREDKNKEHRLDYINVAARIWTGSQNPTYTKAITSTEAIDLINTEMVVILARLLKKKEEELKGLLAI